MSNEKSTRKYQNGENRDHYQNLEGEDRWLGHGVHQMENNRIAKLTVRWTWTPDNGKWKVEAP